MEEEEEDDGISYTEEQAELINTLLAQVEQINKAVQSEKRPYEKKKPEVQRKKPEVVVEIPQRQVKFEAPDVSMKEVKEKPIQPQQNPGQKVKPLSEILGLLMCKRRVRSPAEIILGQDYTVTGAELLQYSPWGCREVSRALLCKGRPEEGINIAIEQPKRVTPLTGKGSVDGHKFNLLFDSGAGLSIMPLRITKKLNYQLLPTKKVISLADHSKSALLGMIPEVLIQIEGTTVSADMYVVREANYDLLLGNGWLHKTSASMKYGEEPTITLEVQGQKICLPVQYGKMPTMRPLQYYEYEEQEEDDEEYDEEEEDEVGYLSLRIDEGWAEEEDPEDGDDYQAEIT